MHNPRFDLAAARVALRAAEDAERTLKAILTMNVPGSNEAQRKGAAAVILAEDNDYQDTLRELRAAEAAVDHAAAAVAVYEDDLRRAELAARERLAEALMGKRADDAVVDYGMPDPDPDADYLDEQYNKTHYIKPTYSDPVFPAGSNAGGEYPRH